MQIEIIYEILSYAKPLIPEILEYVLIFLLWYLSHSR